MGLDSTGFDYGPRIFRPLQAMLKRAMDILGAAVGICLTVLIDSSSFRH